MMVIETRSATAKKNVTSNPAAKPLWVNPNKEVKPITNSGDLKKRTQVLINTGKFQRLMLENKIEAAYEMCISTELDNSQSLVVHELQNTNPISIWATMEHCQIVRNVTTDEKLGKLQQQTETQLFTILQQLINSGAQKFMNLMNEVNKKRPIDQANVIQRWILVTNREKFSVDLNPTPYEFPLYSAIKFGCASEFVAAVLSATNPELLNWIHPTEHKTVFEFTVTKTPVLEDAIKIAELLLPYIGVVINPYRKIVDISPSSPSSQSTVPAALAHVMIIAKLHWREYRSVHLPHQLAISMSPAMLPPLINLIVDYTLECGLTNQTLQCKECKRHWILTADDHEYLKLVGVKSQPPICAECCVSYVREKQKKDRMQ